MMNIHVRACIDELEWQITQLEAELMNDKKLAISDEEEAEN
jgi:hypothetical protein